MGRKKALEITEEHYKQISKLAGLGLTTTKIALVLGIHRATFYEYMKQDPEIERHLELGKALAEGKVGEALYNKAITGDMAAIRWWEMTRAGRSERTEQEVKQTNYVVEVPADGIAATPEEAIANWEAQYGAPDVAETE